MILLTFKAFQTLQEYVESNAEEFSCVAAIEESQFGTPFKTAIIIHMHIYVIIWSRHKVCLNCNTHTSIKNLFKAYLVESIRECKLPALTIYKHIQCMLLSAKKEKIGSRLMPNLARQIRN